MRFVFVVFAALVSILLILSNPKAAIAQEAFSTSYNVTYSVLENGTTHVSFNIALTNNDNQHYASSYKIRLGFENIKNIKASDPDGALATSINKTNEEQEIELTFNKKVVGIGNVLPFSLSFDTDEIARKLGGIWEINIPGISNKNEFKDFNAQVSIPESFGDPAYIKPNLGTKSLRFTKEQLGKSGISIAFGTKQIFGFNLTYHLSNPKLLPIKTEIALPPSTNYQDVFIESISPTPQNVIIDEDGNWLAQYNLSPSQKIDIKVLGKAAVFLYPKKEILTAEKQELYLKEKPYWEQNEKIKKLGRDLKTPEVIYEHVVKALKYDFSRVTLAKPRLGAKSVLENPSSAVCLEFTDLFVALARSAGIPAREVDGFAATENQKQRPLSLIKDVLHAWPEYYDSNLQTWIMVDPTWGNTTKGVDYFNILDFDHFAFAIKGKDSNYPVPAGGYKLATNQNTKDVFVEFSTISENYKSDLEISSNIPNKALSAFPIQGYIIVKNKGQVISQLQLLTVESDGLSPKSIKTALKSIPPSGYLRIPLYFDKTPFLTKRSVTIKITVGKNSLWQKVQISPFFITEREVVIGGVLIVVVAFVLFIARKSWRLPFFRPKG